MHAQHFLYDYDPIGNRTEASRGQEKPVEVIYDGNRLNQYDQTRSDEAVFSTNLTYDEDGNLTGEWLDGDCNCDGQVNAGDINAFNLALSDASEYEMTYPGCTLVTADANNDGNVDVLDINPFVALLLGGGSGGRRLVWDAENRLIGVRPAVEDEDLPDEALRSEFAYDYLNRRVMKRVYEWDNGEDEWTLVLDRRYVYDGWRVVLELDGLNSNAILRKYTWGLDLAGLGGAGVPPANLDSAGGIGGLLAVYDTNGTTTGETPEADDLKYVYTYDANGNVGQLIDVTESTASASIKAHYEYDPYGGVVTSSGTYADTNTYRFSTKPWDDETGLGYWGYRYYDARLGRWVSRDPAHERYDRHLGRFATNAPIDCVDLNGLWSLRFPPPNICKDYTREDYDEFMRKCGEEMTDARKRILDYGCIGICMWAQGQRDPDSLRPPEKYPNTKCYLRPEQAEGRQCGACERPLVWQKQGRWRGGKEPQPRDDGTIPEDSIEPNDWGGFNYDTCHTLWRQRVWICASNGIDPRHPEWNPMTVRIGAQPASTSRDYPHAMFCTTCLPGATSSQPTSTPAH
ncbi:tRNA(Glu)-specific nuclease WapA precursor [Phycisphaerae bacterium RAS1]|nr:tRNA(Glu)-specific nuclease WapA precursor [Phycisphaerae bacterium RAS1]